MQPAATHYERLGGEKSVRELVNRFYDLMDDQDELTELRQLHAKSLKVSREKLFMFLSGWLGGPSLYTDKYGHPRLRARHLPFSIGIEERDQWMQCMKRAMQQMSLDESLQEELLQAFFKTADFMRNRED
ncbi:MAG: group II truncated hemoglobin [Candidatus Thiodiazotropha lotti]|uniref:group II truncated hemoglobin n=1 Tax=Candidatus Thiodiazotropha endoloripes TaxID=1818881 RepID=UPI00083D6DF5|nr:group II truncated hemoglobin [Candidatus Thiodiazotropha endoloripes]MCG7897529.1 group II truncated hemoglobin [Candidatus Thiodiazotropha weberae]MCG7990217.1 group II truncated hemoglobin [Candidatus Thiodiazotropha lotti]MCG7999147.1 group II truncated hemoglobin [Candidatus Thiodiazotropha lotti]MCW4181870.1 group II truncated hemoglobin [Candidatus Thiodiazotropha weberae]MCW4190915.1 group II truncated hemoglobin [Candidatus Thiodiazotropha weberae]